MARSLVILAALAFAALALAACGGDDPVDPAKTDGPRLGFNDVFEAGDPRFAELPASGASIARRPLAWASVEPEPGERNWERLDALYEELISQGIRPLWALASAPCWAAAVEDCTPTDARLAPARDQFGQFAAFAALAVERYPESAGFEIWNEPNLLRFFDGSDGPDFYAEMFELAEAAIHRKRPDMPVVIAGLSPVLEDENDRFEWTGYLERLLELGLGERADAIGLHPYSFFIEGGEFLTEAERMLGQAERLREEAGLELPIWVTEVGVSTEGRTAVSPSRQADQLVAAYELFDKRDVPVVVIHRFADEADPEFQIEGGYGVVGPGGTERKPAFCSLAEVAGDGCE